jgi:hypothetical protein
LRKAAARRSSYNLEGPLSGSPAQWQPRPEAANTAGRLRAAFCFRVWSERSAAQSTLVALQRGFCYGPSFSEHRDFSQAILAASAYRTMRFISNIFGFAGCEHVPCGA